MPFPPLFSISNSPETNVNMLMDLNNGYMYWNVTFRRDLHDWEVEIFDAMMTYLYGVHVRVGKLDRSNGRFRKMGSR